MHPPRAAFCPLLFASNGGRVLGGKLIHPEHRKARGKCDHPFDCVNCHIMQEWIQSLAQQGWCSTWECVACLKKSEEIARHLPGFFSAGRDHLRHPAPSVLEVTGQFDLADPDRLLLRGCMLCGATSSFLQLVLRKRPELDQLYINGIGIWRSR